jgi:hypothetical protein
MVGRDPDWTAVQTSVGDGGSSGDGYFASLFDTSFERFVTPTIIRVLYVLFMIVVGLVSIAFLFNDRIELLFRLIISLLFFFITLTWFRLVLEAVMVLHRIERNTRGSR